MSEVMDAPVAQKREVILNPQRVSLVEHARQDWVVNAEEGTLISDVMSPGYWSHTAAHMQQFDHVEVRMETGEWVAELIVKAVGRNWAAMHLVAKHDLQKSEAPASATKHEVLWRGAQHKHCVKRLSDGAIVQTGLATKEDAQLWLANYEKVLQNT